MLLSQGWNEIKPPSKWLKYTYLRIMFWFVGRAIQATARIDPAIKNEFAALPERFTFCLGVTPNGPYMVAGKDQKGRIHYRGADPKKAAVDLMMQIKGIEAAMRMFTFQESTAIAVARNRLNVHGLIPHACVIVRVLDTVEVYLLPRIIAQLAVKRVPRWSWRKKTLGRLHVYLRTVLGY